MSRRTGRCVGAAAVVAVLLVAYVVSGEEREPGDLLVIHEWGTFTSLQDELGNAIGGINVDDEPVPGFVHRVANLLMRPGVIPSIYSKGTVRAHPDVTMRLETPVIYFYQGPAAPDPQRVNVEVAFRSGWLSEYYPDATAEAPGIHKGSFGPITADTIGRLTWNDLQIGTDAAGPETDSPVWLSPRAVNAANVSTTGGESERFLFYRGVGNLDSPLRVSRDAASASLVITANFPAIDASQQRKFAVPEMWLVDIRDDNSCAFRALDGFQVPNNGQPHVVIKTPAQFVDSEFHANNIGRLNSSMRIALIDDGLFPDEADALLNTWNTSYFASPGLRLFYLLPQAWTDHVLPMKVSTGARPVRTMVGRIEIVTPRQRELLSQIATGPASDAQSLQQSLFSCAAPSPEPADYRAYRELGRFGNALVLDELRHRPTPALQSFVDGYGLHGYRPVALAATSPEQTAANAVASP